MFGRGKKNNNEGFIQGETDASGMPIAPYPVENPAQTKQMKTVQVFQTRPRCGGELFKMEKITQGKNDFILMSIVVPISQANAFRMGKVVIFQ